MIRVCSGNNAGTAGTNYLLGVATTFGKGSIGLLEATATSPAEGHDGHGLFTPFGEKNVKAVMLGRPRIGFVASTPACHLSFLLHGWSRGTRR